MKPLLNICGSQKLRNITVDEQVMPYFLLVISYYTLIPYYNFTYRITILLLNCLCKLSFGTLAITNFK